MLSKNNVPGKEIGGLVVVVVVVVVSVLLLKRMFASKICNVPSSLDDSNSATSEVRLRSRRESAQLASPWLT